MSNFNKLYDILGVAPNVQQDDIKKAYRNLSLQYHPDRGGDEEFYKTITEAYNTLSDENERKKYDFEQNSPFMRMNSMGNISEDDFINIILQGSQNQGFHENQSNPIFFHDLPPTSPFSFFGNKKRNNTPIAPVLLSKTVRITMKQAYTGCVIPILVERKNNKTIETETVYVTIHKGIDNNETITIKEMGNILNETKGDIKIIVTINNESSFTRNGLDILYTQSITLKDALCGSNFEINHISDKTMKFNNLPGNILSSSYKKTIPNYGFIRDEHIGNFIITFNIIFPTNLSSDKIKQLATIL